MENNAGHFREDEGHGRADHAEEAAAGDAHDETPTIWFYVTVKPAIRPLADAKRLPERELGWCGLRFTHSAGAAGADSSASIASMTDFVEIWFIGTARCFGLNSVTGTPVAPTTTIADSERGGQ